MATRPKDVAIIRAKNKQFVAAPTAQESDPHGYAQNQSGAKLDAGKNRIWLCLGNFPHALEQVAKVTSAGAQKYTENGWKDVPNGVDRYMDAFGRHMLAVGRGEVFDIIRAADGTLIDDSVLHEAQMIWNLMAALELKLAAKYAPPPNF